MNSERFRLSLYEYIFTSVYATTNENILNEFLIIVLGLLFISKREKKTKRKDSIIILQSTHSHISNYIYFSLGHK